MLIRSIDFETTGFPTEEDKHAIVEIGWCDLTDGAVGLPSAVLCNPGRPIPHEAMAVHHITDDMVKDATGSPDLLLSGVDYFAAHAADFERQFFNPSYPFICTYKVAVRLWPDAPQHGLQFLRYHLGLAAPEHVAMPPHRAGPDAYMCAVLMQRIMAEPNRPSLEDMVRWSNGPALLPRITFGKHYGLKWEEAPTDYLDWVVKQKDMDKDVLANARHHLKLRFAAQESANG